MFKNKSVFLLHLEWGVVERFGVVFIAVMASGGPQVVDSGMGGRVQVAGAVLVGLLVILVRVALILNFEILIDIASFAPLLDFQRVIWF